MPGDIQKHTLVFTVVFAIVLTLFFDLSRIAALGAIFYIIMDMAIHWGILRHVRDDIDAARWILITALVLDTVLLVALIAVKASDDRVVIYAAVAGLALIFAGERLFMRHHPRED